MASAPASLAVPASVSLDEDPVWAALISAPPASEPLSESELAIVTVALEEVLGGARGVESAVVSHLIEQMRLEQDE